MPRTTEPPKLDIRLSRESDGRWIAVANGVFVSGDTKEAALRSMEALAERGALEFVVKRGSESAKSWDALMKKTMTPKQIERVRREAGLEALKLRLHKVAARNMKVEFTRETDGRWIAEVTNMGVSGLLAYGDTKKAARLAVEELVTRLMLDGLSRR